MVFQDRQLLLRVLAHLTGSTCRVRCWLTERRALVFGLYRGGSDDSSDGLHRSFAPEKQRRVLRSSSTSCHTPNDMALSDKVKTALDETRTLILGCQILLGFQYQSAFRQGFDELPSASRHMSAAALALMLLAICLLIAPSAFHQISQDG